MLLCELSVFVVKNLLLFGSGSPQFAFSPAASYNSNRMCPAEPPMPTNFPCPNVQCSYQFDADILPAAAMVTCPLCRTRFPYRANRPFPTANDVQPADERRPSGPRVVSVRDLPKSGGILRTILSVTGFTIVLVAILYAITMRGQRSRLTDNPGVVTNENFNLSVEPFPSGWSESSEARTPFGANILGRKRAKPEAYVAVSARDWSDRTPRPAELDAQMQRPLREALGTPFFQPIESEKWAGLSALAIQFAGNLNDMQIRGEAFAISYKGIGYVFYAWAPDATWEGQRAELVALREKVTVAGYREKWVEKISSIVVHAPEGAGYQVEDADGAWVRSKPAEEWNPKDKVKYPVDDIKQIDPAATMALLARYQPKERGDAKRQPLDATALVVELGRADNPLEAAKAHVIERIKREYAGSAPEITLEPITKSPSGVALPSNGPAIARLRFRDPQDRDQMEMWVVSAISIGGKTVAVEIKAREKDASYLDEWMIHLAGSLRAK